MLADRLLVFDWDGTLADSANTIVRAMQIAIRELQLETRHDAAVRDVIGLGLDEAVRKLYPDLSPAGVYELAAGYKTHYRALMTETIPLFPEVTDTLRELAEQGFMLAVATGKSRVGLDRSLRETGLEGYFSATRCADETFSKPHPGMLLELMWETGADTDSTLMIGDSVYDMEMADRANVSAVAVSYGVHDRERLLQYQPLLCIDNLTALAQWLQENQRGKTQ
ncbi:MAG TPA: HAD-IA family hydrolase [Gammaproteobacteria bacterium]|nr:HAD-IA family hydrolase [Gammaproteobacteria bacterium]